MSDESRFVSLGLIHLQRLLEIERVSFANPWGKADFCYLLADRDALCLGLLHRGELIGYALGYFAGRDFHLASLAVVPAYRNQGSCCCGYCAWPQSKLLCARGALGKSGRASALRGSGL